MSNEEHPTVIYSEDWAELVDVLYAFINQLHGEGEIVKAQYVEGLVTEIEEYQEDMGFVRVGEIVWESDDSEGVSDDLLALPVPPEDKQN